METQFKIGDLVRLSRGYGYHTKEEMDLVGVITLIRSTDGSYDVQWNDGSYDIDVVDLELELMNEGTI